MGSVINSQYFFCGPKLRQGRTAGKKQLLDEVLEYHRVLRVLDVDELSELGQDAFAEEACKLVVPAFRRFVKRGSLVRLRISLPRPPCADMCISCRSSEM